MQDPRAPVFATVRDFYTSNPFNQPGNIDRLHRALDQAGCPRLDAPPPIGHNQPPPSTDLTHATILEIAEHEGLVLEAYKDSKGIWTWGGGVTAASGHDVKRYKDNPQSLEHVLAVYVWLLREKYLPAVLRAFKGYDLAEHELAAALSFHWNTGAIERADWVKDVLAGRMDEGFEDIMNWSLPREIIPRRKAERNLFFQARWSSDGLVPIYDVRKPSYQPGKARLVDIRAALSKALAQ